MSNEKQRTASERIADIESAMMSLYQANQNISRELLTLKEALKLVGLKLEAVCTAVVNNVPPTNDTLSKLMLEATIESLKSKVSELVSQGVLMTSSGAAGPGTFLVGKELGKDNEIINPRLQFVFGALPEEVQNKLLGMKVGDNVVVDNEKVRSFTLEELYAILAPDTDQSSNTADSGSSSSAQSANADPSAANTNSADNSSSSASVAQDTAPSTVAPSTGSDSASAPASASEVSSGANSDQASDSGPSQVAPAVAESQ